MSSQLGGGQYSILGIVLNDTLYLNLADIDFIKPTNPDTVMIILPGSTGPRIDEKVYNHKERSREWQVRTHTDQELQQQLIAVFDEEYLRGLRNMHTCYVIVTTQ